MRNRQTLTKRIIKGAALLSAMGLLCLGTAGLLQAGQAGGSQPTDYTKMWKQAFSGEQWLAMLHERVHQPIAVWKGMGTGTIEANSTGMSSPGLQFENSRSGVLERQIQLNGLMAKQPLAFLALFDDPDPEVVLTGAAVYYIAQNQGELRAEDLDKAVASRITTAVREKLLPHRDVRIRWTAVQILGEGRWLTPQDIRQILNDSTDEIRIASVFWIPMMRGKWSWDSDPDNTDEPAPGTTRLTRDQFRQMDAHLAQTLLSHLNDTHFYIRQMAGETLRAIFMQRINDIEAEKPSAQPIKLPRDDDWVRIDWQRRVGTQRVWADWWKRYGIAVAP